LLDALGLDPALFPGTGTAAAAFRTLVPRGYAALMEWQRPDDPLLRQVLPVGEELVERPGFVRDPVGDQAALQAPGMLQKYHGRALLMVTGVCAIHCRYCFRRHYPLSPGSLLKNRGAPTFERLSASPDIEEVILSGGDPLMLDDRAFRDLVTRLEALPHLKRLRVHTRLPVVLPSRVTALLCDALASCRLKAVLVVHANHPRELSSGVSAALARLRGTGITVLNQSVLLKGVNDRAQVLSELSERLFENGVLPYYLHLLDRVTGAAHFEVDLRTAFELIQALRARLPGYLVPRLVREEPGRDGKTLLA
jgi:EF-P beta-lysylation protein EpmB